jgi:molybdopterin synthase catalytic subunit
MIRVSAERRAAALDASKWIIDELKRKVPVWKRPRFKKQDQRSGSLLETVTTK